MEPEISQAELDTAIERAEEAERTVEVISKDLASAEEKISRLEQDVIDDQEKYNELEDVSFIADAKYDTGLCIFSFSAGNLQIQQQIEDFCTKMKWLKL